LVVSVEISGVLEEKLRRLVDLGIYASVSEAVRDAVRRMLSEMDLRQIAVNLLINKGCSLHYACEFSNTTCPEFIEYLLLRNIRPPLGYLGNPKMPDPNDAVILDASSLFVALNTTIYNIIERLSNTINVLLPSVLENYYTILAALAVKSGIKINKNPNIINIDELKPPSRLLLTSREYSIIKYVERNKDKIIVTDDLFVQKYLQKNNIKYYSSIEFIIYARNIGLLNDIEYKEALLSLRSLPYIFNL
jgi:Arc/MetJ-type ribon-helix-helix transcriptional regulator